MPKITVHGGVSSGAAEGDAAAPAPPAEPGVAELTITAEAEVTKGDPKPAATKRTRARAPRKSS